MLSHYTTRQIECFWNKVSKTNGGWYWAKRTDDDGYRKAKIAGRMVPAHRVAWTMTYGPITPGKFIAHRCDHPGCVRPDHLFEATPAENSADMVAKRRQARGERVGNAKLTQGDVDAIRALSAAGVPTAAIAARYSIHRTNVALIVAYNTWNNDGRPPVRMPRTKLTEENIARVKEHLAAGKKQKDIAADFGVSRSLIGLIAQGRRRSSPPTEIAK
jgi:hypothetical protein